MTFCSKAPIKGIIWTCIINILFQWCPKNVTGNKYKIKHDNKARQWGTCGADKFRACGASLHSKLFLQCVVKTTLMHIAQYWLLQSVYITWEKVN